MLQNRMHTYFPMNKQGDLKREISLLLHLLFDLCPIRRTIDNFSLEHRMGFWTSDGAIKTGTIRIARVTHANWP